MTVAFLKFDRATLPFLKIDMRNWDPPRQGPLVAAMVGSLVAAMVGSLVAAMVGSLYSSGYDWFPSSGYGWFPSSWYDHHH